MISSVFYGFFWRWFYWLVYFGHIQIIQWQIYFLICLFLFAILICIDFIHKNWMNFLSIQNHTHKFLSHWLHFKQFLWIIDFVQKTSNVRISLKWNLFYKLFEFKTKTVNRFKWSTKLILLKMVDSMWLDAVVINAPIHWFKI